MEARKQRHCHFEWLMMRANVLILCGSLPNVILKYLMRYLMDSSACLSDTKAWSLTHAGPFPQMPFLPFYDTMCVAACKTSSITSLMKNNQTGHLESIVLLIPHRNASEVLSEEHFAKMRQIQRKQSVGVAEWRLYSDPDRQSDLEEKHLSLYSRLLRFKSSYFFLLLAKNTP